MKVNKSKNESTREKEVYEILRDKGVYDKVNDVIKTLEPLSKSLDKVNH